MSEGLYPLNTNNSMMPIIARLMGYSVGNTQSSYPVNSIIDQKKYNDKDFLSLFF